MRNDLIKYYSILNFCFFSKHICRTINNKIKSVNDLTMKFCKRVHVDPHVERTYIESTPDKITEVSTNVKYI